MDERLVRDLIIGTAGSIIGAALVFLGTYGFRLTTDARRRLKEYKEQEVESWRTGGADARQAITNQYLFTILKHLFLANMFWVLGEGAPEIIAFQLRSETLYLIVFSAGRILTLLFFFLGLGKTLRFMNIQKAGS